ncbi:hypothetical protein WJX74_002489 [Apatococcus lobatus]|uniref:ALA-interacting subunit n=1 Tax=Apatococcus lobatus TaxID=904363 RepID=A0AAW1SB02_9CHLO
MSTAPAPKKKTREPRNSRFTQQELPAWQPLLTPTVVISIFFLIGVVFVPIGVGCLVSALKVIEVTHRYDDICIAGDNNAAKETTLMQQDGLGTNCTVTLTIPKAMKAPVYIYYEIDNFYQNHRRFVKSTSNAQLRGEAVAASTLTNCEPELYQDSNKSALINPCGLPAWSYFNDTFAVALTSTTNGDPVLPGGLYINDSNIAWDTDTGKRIGHYIPQNLNTDPASRGGQTVTGYLNEDQHFAVWMRIAQLANFRKLYGRIDSDFAAGDTVTVTLANRYNTYRFNGQKHVVLSTTSWIGGHNPFLGIGYLTCGGCSFVFGIIFCMVVLCFPRKLGDVSYLSWNQGHGLDPSTRGRL